VAAVLAPVLGLFAPLLIAPLAVVAMVAAILIDVRRKPSFPRIDWPFLALLFGLLGWSAVTLIWSVDGMDAVRKWATVAAAMVPFAYLILRIQDIEERERRFLGRAICLGAGLGAGLLVFEIITDGFIILDVLQQEPPKGKFTQLINRAAAVLLLFAWLAVASAQKYRWPIIVAGAILGYLMPSESALLAYVVGGVVYIATLVAPWAIRIMLPAAMVGTILLAPILFTAIDQPVRSVTGQHNPSIVHRLEIWNFAIERIRERPWVGWGFNGSRAVPGGNQRYQVKDGAGTVIGEGDRLPLHPHNGALQIWLELGAPGALLAAVLAGLVGYRAAATSGSKHRAMATALTTTVFLVWMLSFGIWQSWWLAHLCLTALLAVPFCRQDHSPGRVAP
ncbi:MAG: O-antigen ligase family protein, partial [Rhodospirillaceae bacterium]|nr:O-antigen ligase family protein [Rhodospirillaceae bacterium]